MDPDEVLGVYLNSVNQNLDELQNYLASNSVLEWFGKTFRTSRKIIEGFRYDLCEQYEHNFTKAEYCSPFDDSKETHLITRKAPPENFIDVNLIAQSIQPSTSSSSPGGSATNNLDGYITPPQIKRSPILPKLTQGRKFMSDSDTDSDSEEKSDEIKNRKRGDSLNVTGIDEINQSVTEESERMNANLCRNTIKRPHLKRSEANISRSDSEDEDDAEQQPQLKLKKNEDDELDAGNTNKYSELKYIQTTGLVKQIRSKKHRGIIGGTTLPASISSPSSSSINELLHLTPSSTACERTACLKISYRLRLIDNHIQFALIVYDALNKNPRTRRNLFNEFQKIQLPNKSNRRGDTLSSKKKSDTKNSTSTSNLSSGSFKTISKKSLRF